MTASSCQGSTSAPGVASSDASIPLPRRHSAGVRPYWPATLVIKLTQKITLTAGYPATVTLTCATAGAAIWYTIDGSYPGSNPVASPNATLYTGPFVVQAAGVTIRAAAELSQYQQSQSISQVSLQADFSSDFGQNFNIQSS